jgi:hypothetical protein
MNPKHEDGQHRSVPSGASPGLSSVAPMRFEPTLPPCQRPDDERHAAHEKAKPPAHTRDLVRSPNRTQLEPDSEVGRSNGGASICHRINRLKTPWTLIWHLERSRQDSQGRYEPFIVGAANSRNHWPPPTGDLTIGGTHYGTRGHRYLTRDI